MMKKAILAAAIAVGVAAPAIAADPIEGAIKARQGYFQLVLSNFGPLVGMAKGQVEYDAEKAATYAANLDALTSMKNGHLWLPGSDNGAMAGKTRALPAIWADGSDIGAKSKAFADAVDALVAAAPTGLDALQPAVGATGATCGACHKAYRAESF